MWEATVFKPQRAQRKVFTIEGAEGFGPSEFSAEAVLDPVFCLPEAGWARFIIPQCPKGDAQQGKTFFIWVKMR